MEEVAERSKRCQAGTTVGNLGSNVVSKDLTFTTIVATQSEASRRKGKQRAVQASKDPEIHTVDAFGVQYPEYGGTAM
jgi:hypothetical protein